MSNNFHKTSLLKINELETFGARKRILRKIWRDVVAPESVQSCFELKMEGCSCARERPVVF